MEAIKLTGKVLIFLFCMISIIMLSTCKKEETKINIVLYDKPLDVIKSHVQGEWRLQKVTGGICTTCGAPVKDNPYMNISDDHIVMGNDIGITLDTIIVWRRDRDIFKDSTYLLSYRDSKIYNLPIYKVVDRIENSALILIDNADDAFYYYYVR